VENLLKMKRLQKALWDKLTKSSKSQGRASVLQRVVTELMDEYNEST